MRSSRPRKAEHQERTTQLELTIQMSISTSFRLTMDPEYHSPITPNRLRIIQVLISRLRSLPPMSMMERSLRRRQSPHQDMRKCSNKVLPMISKSDSVGVLRNEGDAFWRCSAAYV